MPSAALPASTTTAASPAPTPLRLDDLTAVHHEQLRADKEALFVLERKTAALHYPRNDAGPIDDRAFRNLQHASYSERVRLMGVTAVRAIPFLKKIDAASKAPKLYRSEALPADFAACLERLEALGLQKSSLPHAYVSDLLTCQELSDTIISALGRPMRRA